MDSILDPQVSADISNYTAYGTPNRVSIERSLILPDSWANPAIYPSAETLANLFLIVDIEDDAEIAYQTAWNDLKTFYAGN